MARRFKNDMKGLLEELESINGNIEEKLSELWNEDWD